MIKAKVTKKIMTKGEFLTLGTMAITKKQTILSGIILMVNIGIYFLLDKFTKMDMNFKLGTVFVTLALSFLGGVIQIQGMNFVKFLAASLKGVDRRPFCIKPILDQDENDL